MSVEPKKLNILNPEICKSITSPIIVDDDGDVDVYANLRDAVADVESVDIERGTYVFADAYSTELVLRLLPAGRKHEANLEIRQRPLGEDVAQRMRRHMLATLNRLGQQPVPDSSLADLANSILAITGLKGKG